ncbi:MAG: fimbrillin family protein [Bacteroides sp.]|nr:fimbrillin family protein [Bacteroides sp.]
MAELTTRAGYESNATDDTKSILPQTFYLTVTQEGGNSQYNYANVKMTKGDENDYSPEYSLLWKDGSHSAIAVNAYTFEGTAFTVQTDQSTTDKVLASDLLGAIKATENSDITISEDNIGITFRHLLCKLDVTYTWGDELQIESIKSRSIKSVIYKGFGTDVTLTRETAAVAKGSNTAEIKAYVDGEKSEAIFAPYWGTSPQICIIIETTTGEGEEAVTENRSFVLNVTTPASGFTSGNRYTMNVTIGGTVTQTGDISIAAGWETGDANGDEDGTTGNMATN